MYWIASYANSVQRKDLILIKSGYAWLASMFIRKSRLASAKIVSVDSEDYSSDFLEAQRKVLKRINNLTSAFLNA